MGNGLKRVAKICGGLTAKSGKDVVITARAALLGLMGAYARNCITS